MLRHFTLYFSSSHSNSYPMKQGTSCGVTCTGGSSCIGTMDAADALFLSITIPDGNAIQTINNALIKCPKNGPGGGISCVITSQSTSSNQMDQSVIEVQEGFNELEITCPAFNCMGTGIPSVTQVKCGKNFEMFCNLGDGLTNQGSGPWNECRSGENVDCEAYTLPPATQSPTTYPTSDPTTDPTKDPTDDPTNDPTENPSLDPTSEPTTSDPTKHPTSEPTAEPTAPIQTTDGAISSNSPTTAGPTTSAPTMRPSTSPVQTGVLYLFLWNISNYIQQ